MDSFEKRKRDHIEISLSAKSQSSSGTGLDKISLKHEALPELNLDQVKLNTTLLGHHIETPFFVSSMTLGHDGAQEINHRLAKLCYERGWAMGVGSQRGQLESPDKVKECEKLRDSFEGLFLLGNIGLSQLIDMTAEQAQGLVDSLGAKALIVHTNPLQECVQAEGTPFFSGGLDRLQALCTELTVPVVLKETGCGFSKETLSKIFKMKLAAVDVSGHGGTHWGRIEGLRSQEQSLTYRLGENFSEWGHKTADCLQWAKSVGYKPSQLMASGGLKNGIDAAKCLALGAGHVGFARTLLLSATKSEEALKTEMKAIETELRIAMFCMGVAKISDFTQRVLWQQTMDRTQKV